MGKRDLYHEFVGSNARCGLKGCQLGRPAAVHRKPRDFPECRLEVAEAEIKRLKRGFRYLADGLALIEEVLNAMSPFYGASGAGTFMAESKWGVCAKKFAEFHKKYAPKTAEGPKTGT